MCPNSPEEAASDPARAPGAQDTGTQQRDSQVGRPSLEIKVRGSGHPQAETGDVRFLCDGHSPPAEVHPSFLSTEDTGTGPWFPSSSSTPLRRPKSLRNSAGDSHSRCPQPAGEGVSSLPAPTGVPRSHTASVLAHRPSWAWPGLPAAHTPSCCTALCSAGFYHKSQKARLLRSVARPLPPSTQKKAR